MVFIHVYHSKAWLVDGYRDPALETKITTTVTGAATGDPLFEPDPKTGHTNMQCSYVCTSVEVGTEGANNRGLFGMDFGQCHQQHHMNVDEGTWRVYGQFHAIPINSLDSRGQFPAL